MLTHGVRRMRQEDILVVVAKLVEEIDASVKRMEESAARGDVFGVRRHAARIVALAKALVALADAIEAMTTEEAVKRLLERLRS